MCFFVICSCIFIQMTLICYQLDELSIKPASWNLFNFGGWPKCLKGLSQSRPMTDFVRKNHPRTLDQPSLILSLLLWKSTISDKNPFGWQYAASWQRHFFSGMTHPKYSGMHVGEFWILWEWKMRRRISGPTSAPSGLVSAGSVVGFDRFS